jgi:hypothetical protein
MDCAGKSLGAFMDSFFDSGLGSGREAGERPLHPPANRSRWGGEGQTMSEAEWLTSTDPDQMLRVLRRKATDRQYRLFAVACARDELDHALKTQFAYNFGRMHRIEDDDN